MTIVREISSSHGGEYDVQSLMMEAVCTSETSVDNHFTRQYIPEDNSEQDHSSVRRHVTFNYYANTLLQI
jgi:homoserine trans-succinylase